MPLLESADPVGMPGCACSSPEPLHPALFLFSHEPIYTLPPHRPLALLLASPIAYASPLATIRPSRSSCRTTRLRLQKQMEQLQTEVKKLRMKSRFHRRPAGLE